MTLMALCHGVVAKGPIVRSWGSQIIISGDPRLPARPGLAWNDHGQLVVHIKLLVYHLRSIEMTMHPGGALQVRMP